MESKIEEDLLDFYGRWEDESERREIGIEMKDDYIAIMDRVSDYDIHQVEFVLIVDSLIEKMIK